MVSRLKPLQDKSEYYVCALDIRGNVTEINQQTGQKTQRPIRPEETVWVKYEEIFTNKYDIITPKYKEYLDTFTENDYIGVMDENYVRVWTRPYY